MLTPEQRREKIWDVVRVSSGNFLENARLLRLRLFRGLHRQDLLPDRQRILRIRSCCPSAPSPRDS